MINTAQDPILTPNSNNVVPPVPEAIDQTPQISQTPQLPETPQIPQTPSPSENNNTWYIFILGTIAIFALIVFVFVRIINNSSKQIKPQSSVVPVLTPAPTPAPTPTPTPTPIPLIPDEGTKGNYKVTQGAHTGPSFTLVTFDPLAVDINQTLTITVKLTSKTPIDQVTGILTMDNSQANLSFQKTGTEVGQIETWQANTLLKDSVLYNYILSLSAKSGNDTSTVTVAPRSRP
jgi:hypothetical protein